MGVNPPEEATLAYADCTLPEPHYFSLSFLPDMKLELVPIPVSDIDAAISFYADLIGFHLDHDVKPAEGVRVAQLTPPGSACSIVLGKGLPGIEMETGSQRGIHLVVENLDQVRNQLVSKGVEVSEIVEYDQGIKYAYFADPDGNTWALQEIPKRT